MGAFIRSLAFPKFLPCTVSQFRNETGNKKEEYFEPVFKIVHQIRRASTATFSESLNSGQHSRWHACFHPSEFFFRCCCLSFLNSLKLGRRFLSFSSSVFNFLQGSCTFFSLRRFFSQVTDWTRGLKVGTKTPANNRSFRFLMRGIRSMLMLFCRLRIVI